MHRFIYICLFALLTFGPPNVYSEHDCIDPRYYGKKVSVKNPLPTHWFSLGTTQLTDTQLHATLKGDYKKYYTAGKDGEGFTIDHFCGFRDGLYLTISNGDFGPYAEFSKEPPKCYPCNPVNEDMPYFTSGTGLNIGQDKGVVSKILGHAISDDITSIIFNEIEQGKGYEIWHSQTLRTEFRDNKLVRFSIDDSREKTR